MAEHDLISKKALLEHLDMAMECENCPRNADKELYKCVHNPTSERCTCSDIAQICIRITEFATFADVQPVKHGRWIYVGSVRSWDEIKCSACNSAFSTEDRDLILNWDFCPHCGARMDGEQND